MNLQKFSGPGSTPARCRFWDKAYAEVTSLRKVAGRFVTISEQPGQGTVINVAESSVRRGGGRGGATGACCNPDDQTCNIRTEAECAGLGHIYQGDGAPCDPNPCGGGACCIDGACSHLSGGDCIDRGGIYQGDGTVCGDHTCDGRCCLPDHSCETLSSADCATAGGTFIPGTSCDDAVCTCCNLTGEGLFSPGCEDGDGNCWTGPEHCDGTCGGEMVPCDSRWLAVDEYCIDCPGGLGALCFSASWNPLTCELTSSGDCSECGGGGTTTAASFQYNPCVP